MALSSKQLTLTVEGVNNPIFKPQGQLSNVVSGYKVCLFL
jgi:hypothetical protein